MASIEDESNEEEFANFKVRFNGEELPFITMQAPTAHIDDGKSRKELLADSTSFFYQWLCLAKHADTNEDSAIEVLSVPLLPHPVPGPQGSDPCLVGGRY
ncbi:unnamed protein product [Prorocentrum cordatum]|uniref:Arp2/3 complex 34 kDa subunit n=1 Tax=Prorocentrum cordatum TaxID=2364126 RepID=A0ABN9QE41_9DINO|nr:unnamed protein product [Polarella glacialis]